MTNHFATAMRRALESTRALDPVEATTVIQAALSGSAHSGDTQPPRNPTSTAQRARFSLLDPAADRVVEHGRHKPLPHKTTGFGSEPPQPPASSSSYRIPAPTGVRKRRPLAEVVDCLSRGRPGGLVSLPGATPTQAPSVPPGACYETRSFSSAGSARDYRLYVPSGLRPRGLLVMLHGCTQTPDDFAMGTNMNAHAEKHGLLIAYPAQTGAHNASACWNWFRPGDQMRDRGEPALIAGITRDLLAEFDVEPSRVFCAGLSAGGAMAVVMGEAYPDLYRAIGVHSGLPSGSAHDVPSAFSAMRGEAGELPPRGRMVRGVNLVRTIVFHGSADSTVHPSNAMRIATATEAQAEELSVTQETATSQGGRSYHRTVTVDRRGQVRTELWLVDGLGHAWSGGAREGSHTDPRGPDASAEMVRFFLSAS